MTGLVVLPNDSPLKGVSPALRALFVASSIIALLATGCGGSDEASSSESATNSELDASYRDADSPLNAVLGFDLSDRDAALDQERLLEQKIQECMSAQGFEYQMATVNNVGQIVAGSDLSAEDYAAQHGYAIADSALETVTVFNNAASGDPNAAALDAMSDTERAAWETAAYGAPVSELSAENAADGGCFGEAQSVVFGAMQGAFEELGPAIDTMYDAYDADERIVAITKRWAQCMGEAGYDFATYSDAYDAAAQNIDEVMAWASLPPDSSEERVVPSVEELQPQLEAMKTKEVEIAVADAQCQKGDLDEVAAVRREYELQFIEDNQATLGEVNS